MVQELVPKSILKLFWTWLGKWPRSVHIISRDHVGNWIFEKLEISSHQADPKQVHNAQLSDQLTADRQVQCRNLRKSEACQYPNRPASPNSNANVQW